MTKEKKQKNNTIDTSKVDVLNQTRLRPLHLKNGQLNMSLYLFTFSEALATCLLQIQFIVTS